MQKKSRCGTDDDDHGDAVAENFLNGLLKEVTRLLIHVVIYSGSFLFLRRGVIFCFVL
jgi:hypothetical protein